MAFVRNFLGKHSIRSSNSDVEIGFWNAFYQHLHDQYSSLLIKPSTSLTSQYQDHAFSLLEAKKKSLPFLSMGELKALQLSIERSTLLFDSESIFKTSPIILEKLIGQDKVNAKDYVRGSKNLDDEDLEMLSEFGPYILECLIVHVLSMVFSSNAENSAVRIAYLVSQLDIYVRLHAHFLKYERVKQPYKMEVLDDLISAKKKTCPIGNILVHFMEERGVICIVNVGEVDVKKVKGKGRYFHAGGVYAQCNFDLSLLPMKLNLPMVHPPLDWQSALPEGEIPSMLRDLSGGYLNSMSGELYNRYRLLSTGDIDRFHIIVDGSYMRLCSVMNKLQGQAFQINSLFLDYLKSNEDFLVYEGLLMPRFLASLNMKSVSSILKSFYDNYSSIKSYCSYPELLNSLSKQIQQSRYEESIIQIASAYDGYHFYLPVFLDFRGRIYRSGILHYHERDLARSLILFVGDNNKTNALHYYSSLVTATAYHYKSFPSYSKARSWFYQNVARSVSLPSGQPKGSLTGPNERRAALNMYHNLCGNSSYLLENLSPDLLREAKRPFQFLSHSLGLFDYSGCLPITQDASASAYQIMSYFLLDFDLAMKTNLIQSHNNEIIHDVYSYMLDELQDFMNVELPNDLSSQVLLTRKLVKDIFMPIIYGKTVMSTAIDIKKDLRIQHSDCMTVAKACFKFWREHYKHLYCLMELIGDIGWLVASRGGSVVYGVPHFCTHQDYRRKKALTIYVKNHALKKRHRVTLTVPSEDLDCRKTETATFVNFIHQRDASIAMQVVEGMISLNAPIYTVHDNFLTTVAYSSHMATLYNNVFMEMGPPLAILHEFIYQNVIHNHPEAPPLEYFMNKVIPIESLSEYLSHDIPVNNHKSFEDRISKIVRNYNTYTHIVCGKKCDKDESDKDRWIAHLVKWEAFKKGLNKEEGGLRYSVHH